MLLSTVTVIELVMSKISFVLKNAAGNEMKDDFLLLICFWASKKAFKTRILLKIINFIRGNQLLVIGFFIILCQNFNPFTLFVATNSKTLVYTNINLSGLCISSFFVSILDYKQKKFNIIKSVILK